MGKKIDCLSALYDDLAYQRRRLDEVDAEGKPIVEKFIQQIERDISRERNRSERAEDI